MDFGVFMRDFGCEIFVNFSVFLGKIHKAGSALGEKSLLTNFGRHFVFSLACVRKNHFLTQNPMPLTFFSEKFTFFCKSLNFRFCFWRIL